MVLSQPFVPVVLISTGTIIILERHVPFFVIQFCMMIRIHRLFENGDTIICEVSKDNIIKMIPNSQEIVVVFSSRLWKDLLT